MQTRGHAEYLPDARAIRAIFEEEVHALGGVVTDQVEHGPCLYLRSVLPASALVRPGDRMKAGVAMRVHGPQVFVHPYTFREVCTNGAIRAQALDSRHLVRVDAPSFADEAVVASALRDAVRACGSREAFATSMLELRSADAMLGDHLIALMPLIARMHGVHREDVVRTVVRRHAAAPDPDRTAFGVINAITSVARDERDPELRWRLEALGAAVPAWIESERGRAPQTVARARSRAIDAASLAEHESLAGAGRAG